MGGENPFGKGLPEIILCSPPQGPQSKGFAFAWTTIQWFVPHESAALHGIAYRQHHQ